MKNLLEEIDTSIFSECSEKLLSVIPRLNKLTEPELLVLMIYAETGSLYKTGKLLKVSDSVVREYLVDLRHKLGVKYEYIR